MTRLLDRLPLLIAGQVRDSLSLWRERAWGIGRIISALAVLAGTHLLLRGNPAYWVFVGGTLLVVAYGAALLTVLSRKRLFPVFAIGFAADNLILLIAWWVYLHLNRGALESNDLWLIIVPVVMFGIVRVGWIAGALLAVFWLSWLSWSASHYFPADSYDVTQLPLRLMFIGVSFVLVLRLVAMVSRERRLERARMEELARLDRFKSSLMRSISHELRTPLTSARVYSELLEATQEPGQTPEKTRIVRGLKSSIDRLERIVEQSTDFAFISASEPSSSLLESFDLGTVVEHGVDLLRPEFEAREQALETDVRPALRRARGNPGQVERVLLILLDNANRYSPKGCRVRVDVSEEDSTLRVSVQDEGPGIPEEDREFIFSSFFRGSQADRLGTPGAGMGLALARELIERQRGTIGLEPRAGGGTVAYFTLPAEG